MDTAAALRDEQRLDFVVAPLRTSDGETVRPLGPRHAVSVFPFVDGTPGDFDQGWTPGERGAVLDLLAELHRRPPPPAAPVLDVALPLRGLLDKALAGTVTWADGPFAEPARDLLADHAAALRARVEEFDGLANDLGTRGVMPVLTHGEPHPGNLLDLHGRFLLIDWDTTGVAPPERDLWSVEQGPQDLERYAAAAGRTPDPGTLTLYRLRWDLEEISLYVDWFRAPHERSPDTDTAWDGLVEAVENLTAAP
ncbi:phosphotransferase [Actinomadura graeca]|uniref:phosphotransferase n=1 Tax=Actinomadura graeca TaxID=2750812 RepID=UPI001E2A63DD|nr:phosphotransferase [Actinomadura graeca]